MIIARWKYPILPAKYEVVYKQALRGILFIVGKINRAWRLQWNCKKNTNRLKSHPYCGLYVSVIDTVADGTWCTRREQWKIIKKVAFVCITEVVLTSGWCSDRLMAQLESFQRGFPPVTFPISSEDSNFIQAIHSYWLFMAGRNFIPNLRGLCFCFSSKSR